jgi:hypothetical protein
VAAAGAFVFILSAAAVRLFAIPQNNEKVRSFQTNGKESLLLGNSSNHNLDKCHSSRKWADMERM